MGFLTWLGNLITEVGTVVNDWESKIVYGISWLEGLFGKGVQDANNALQIVSIVDQNLASISVAIVQEAGTIEAMLTSLKNINPADMQASILAIQQDAEKMYEVWSVQRTAILNAITEISKQITVIENTGI